jgi:hypothetical protein
MKKCLSLAILISMKMATTGVKIFQCARMAANRAP